MYTYNPHDPCFTWKRPCFQGLTFKNRGHWVLGVCVNDYIYTVYTPFSKNPEMYFIFTSKTRSVSVLFLSKTKTNVINQPFKAKHPPASSLVRRQDPAGTPLCGGGPPMFRRSTWKSAVFCVAPPGARRSLSGEDTHPTAEQGKNGWFFFNDFSRQSHDLFSLIHLDVSVKF